VGGGGNGDRYTDSRRIRRRRLGLNSNTISRWERGDTPIGNPRMLDLALKALERGA